MFIQPNPRITIAHIANIKSAAAIPAYLWAGMEGGRVILFSRGQWAIKEMASCIIKRRGQSRGLIFIPDYFCEISLTPLRIPDFDIRFYRITPELIPDMEHLEALRKQCGVPDMLLYVHYFGMPSNMHVAADWCREHQVDLVEDAAHTLLPIPCIGDHRHPTIYTPWKFLNIPSGALLALPEDYAFSLDARSGLDGASSFPLAWMAKQLISTLTQDLGVPLYKFKRIRVKASDESEPPTDPGRPGCARYFANVLSRMGNEITAIGQTRERNYRRLDEAIVASKAERFRLFRKLPVRFIPYVYPLRIIGGSSVDIMNALNRIGIPAQPWSDLSPEVKGSVKYPLSNALRREVLVLPVHQSLSLKQVDWMSCELIKQITLREDAL